MKKVVLSLAVLFTVALASCGNKKAEAVDSDSMMDTLVEDTMTVQEDTVNADTTLPAEEVKADSVK